MVSWQEFTDTAPEFAPRVRARFEGAESRVPATFRRYGSPRVSDTEVRFALDTFHVHPADNGDAKVAAVAAKIACPPEKQAAQGDQPSRLSNFDIDEAVLSAVDVDTVVVTRWRAGQPLVRSERPGNGSVMCIER
jgi:hypothetical protein